MPPGALKGFQWASNGLYIWLQNRPESYWWYWMIQLFSSVTQVLAGLFPWIMVKFVINLYLRLWIGSSVPSGAPGFCGRHDVSWRLWNMKGFLLVGDPWDFVSHLMRSGGIPCVPATWRVLTGGSFCTSFGFPAAS